MQKIQRREKGRKGWELIITITRTTFYFERNGGNESKGTTMVQVRWLRIFSRMLDREKRLRKGRICRASSGRTSLLPTSAGIFSFFVHPMWEPRERETLKSPPFFSSWCLKRYIYHHLVERSFEKETLEVASSGAESAAFSELSNRKCREREKSKGPETLEDKWSSRGTTLRTKAIRDSSQEGNHVIQSFWFSENPKKYIAVLEIFP